MPSQTLTKMEIASFGGGDDRFRVRESDRSPVGKCNRFLTTDGDNEDDDGEEEFDIRKDPLFAAALVGNSTFMGFLLSDMMEGLLCSSFGYEDLSLAFSSSA